jgi:hypothetical protein
MVGESVALGGIITPIGEPDINMVNPEAGMALGT